METTVKRSHYQNDGDIKITRESEENGQRVIEGYAIRFNSPSVPFAEDDDARVIEYISPEAISEEMLRSQDIKMTLYHDMHRLLARSKRGQGSLQYSVDERGVKFRFAVPATADGEMAAELVARGDIDGCSFMFSTYYGDRDYVERSVRTGADGKKEIVYTVRKITGLYDFTLTPDPAYPETSVNAAKRDIESAQCIEHSAQTEENQEERANEPFSMDQYLNLLKILN